jgi:putative peptidoglycan lipid II flippase
VLKQMAPALLGVSVAQLSLLINTQIASHLGPGAVSWLFYADRLMEFPTALLGVALSAVLIPGLSARRAQNDDEGYSDQLDWGLRLVVLLALPFAVAMLVFAKPLVAVLFHYGKFSPEAVEMTVLALRGYGCGLMGIIGVKVLAPGFFAQQDLRTPVRIAIVVLICTQLMNLAFVPWLGHAGLALSIGLGAMINAGWLLWGLRRQGHYRPRAGWMSFVARVLPANVLMGGGLYVASTQLDWLGLQAHSGVRAAWLAGVMAAAVLGYFGTLRISGVDLRQFARRA